DNCAQPDSMREGFPVDLYLLTATRNHVSKSLMGCAKNRLQPLRFDVASLWAVDRSILRASVFPASCFLLPASSFPLPASAGIFPVPSNPTAHSFSPLTPARARCREAETRTGVFRPAQGDRL